MKKKQPNHLKLLIPLSVFAVLAIVWLMKGPAVSGSPLFQYDWNVYLPLITNNYVSPPPASASHYMVYPISSSNLTNEGCAEGQASRGNVVVVLDFGFPAYQSSSYGASTWWPTPNYHFYPNNQISDLVKNFIQGYWNCVPKVTPNHLELALGINNQGILDLPSDPIHPNNANDNEKQAHGQAWANMVNGLNTWVSACGAGCNYSLYISISAAFDIEPYYSDAYSVQRWVTGYDSVNNWPYYDFGSCDSCPYTFPGGGGHPGWVPPGDWTLDNIRYVSWGANPAFPLPEIYTTDQSQAYQWQNISLYNYIYYNHTHMTFKGAMTQYQACQDNPPCPLMDNTAETGWEQLYSALDSDDRTRQYLLVNPMWSTDIQWRP